jgi:succinate-acetate transporter protein
MASQDIEKQYSSTAPLNGVTQYAAAPRSSKIGNPGTLGLFSFASTTLILSLYNAQARGIEHPNVVLGMAIFCGGLAQLLAGMWEFPRGNAFSGTAFTSYGAFWMAYATILIPGSGVLAAYAGNKDEISSAIGIFLITWMLVTFFLFIAALRKNLALVLLFGCLTTTFLLLAASEFAASVKTKKAGGIVGVITAFIAYYTGLSELLAAEEKAIVSLPLGAF